MQPIFVLSAFATLCQLIGLTLLREVGFGAALFGVEVAGAEPQAVLQSSEGLLFSLMALCGGYGLIVIGFMIMMLASIDVCQKMQFPKTPRARWSLAAAGFLVAVLAGSYWTIVMQRLADDDSLLMVAACAQAVASLGLTAILCAAASAYFKKGMFDGSWVGDATISLNDQTIAFEAGEKITYLPVKQIEHFTFYLEFSDPTAKKKYVMEVDPLDGRQIRHRGFADDARFEHLRSICDQVTQTLAQRELEKLKGGQEISSGDWAIAGDYLRIKQLKENKDLNIRLNEISAIRAVGGEQRIWVKGMPKHVAALPDKSKDALILSEVLAYFVDLNSNLATQHEQTEDNCLVAESEKRQVDSSQVLFEDEQEHASGLVMIVGSLVAGIGLATVVYLCSGNLMGAQLIGLAICGFGLAVSIAAILAGETANRSFCIFSNAVSDERGGKVTRLEFDQLDSFSRKVTHVYQNGMYSGTNQDIVFKTSTEQIKYRTSTIDVQFDKMMDRISEAIGLKLASELAEAESVAWTAKGRIRKEGLELMVRNGLSKSMKLIRWDEIAAIDFKSGTASICVVGEKKAAAKLKCEEENFFPGLFLVQQLLAVHNVSAQVDTCAGQPVG